MIAWVKAHKLAVAVAVAIAAFVFWWLRRRVAAVGIVDVPVIGSGPDFGGHSLGELDDCIERAMAGDGTC